MVAEVKIALYAAERGELFQARRVAEWSGAPAWGGAPREGDMILHCEEWAPLHVARVFYRLPGRHRSGSVIIEVDVDRDELQHLLDAHGWVV